MATGDNEKSENLLQDKKNLVVNDKSTGKKRIAAGAAVLIVALLAGAGVWFAFNSPDSEKTADKGYDAGTTVQSRQVEATDDSTVFDAGLFNDGTAHFFKYKYQDTKIGYFILKGRDGVVRSAFNACDVCWRAGKGYTQRGDIMVCNNCGREFPSNMIGRVSGGCNPTPLHSIVSDGKIIIKNSDIIKGLEYFKGIEGI